MPNLADCATTQRGRASNRACGAEWAWLQIWQNVLCMHMDGMSEFADEGHCSRDVQVTADLALIWQNLPRKRMDGIWRCTNEVPGGKKLGFCAHGAK